MRQRSIDNKHSIFIDDVTDSPFLAKRLADGELQPIPADEPTILFRGRDRLALPMLEFYRSLCFDDGATPYQLESMDDMIRKFRKFSATSKTMKQPGSTLGR